MAFINDYLPLPTKPLINSTFTYKTNVLMNSELKEQRIPVNSEYRLVVDLSDVTFTETELTTFITFYRDNLKGKLNTFKLRHPFENTTTLGPFQLDEAGTMFSYGRAVYIGTDPDIGGNHLFRVFKVYEYRNGTDVYRVFKTIQAIDDTETIDIRRDDGTLPIGSGVVVKTLDNNQVLSVNGSFYSPSGTAAGELIQVACTYDHVMRLDVDAIPQISLALRPEGQTTGCDVYRFESLELVEEINERVTPYHAIAPSTAVPLPTTGDTLVLGSGLTNSIFTVIIPREFDLPLRPIETIEYKFDTKIVSINDFEFRDSYSNEDDRWRGVFDSTRVRQERAQEIAAFFFLAKGRLHRFTVNFRNVPTQTGRFDQDSITFNHLVAASEANYHLFATNVTQKSLYDLQSLEFIAATGVDPIDLTDNNEIACTTGTATYVLTFTDIDTATNFEGAFYTDLKFLSVEQSSLVTLDVPLFTVAQNVSGTIEITEGGYGTDPIVQRVQKTLINGRLGIDSNDIVGVAANKDYIAIATDGDVEVYLKSNLTTPVLAATAEEIYELDGNEDDAPDARIVKVTNTGSQQIMITAIDQMGAGDDIAAAAANTTALNFFGVGGQDTGSSSSVFTQLEITENQSVFFDPANERIRYSQNNDFSGVNLALTPPGAGTNAIAHDVINFTLDSQYTAVIAGNAAPENGLTMASIFPVEVLVNTTGANQDVLDAVSLAGFNHTRRLLDINDLYFPQDGVVGTAFSAFNGFLNYEDLISPTSPLQASDMTTREFYGGTIGGNGAAYTWRAGNATPTAPYAIGTDFELTQINGNIQLVKEPADLYELPPFTVPTTAVFIDPDNLTPTQITDNGGYYAGNTGGGAGGTGGTAGAGGAANISGFTATGFMDQLPPDNDASTVFWNIGLVLSSAVTGQTVVLAYVASTTSSVYSGRYVVYRLQIIAGVYTLVYDAAASAITREFTVTSHTRPKLYRHANGDIAAYRRANNNAFGNPYSASLTGIARFAIDDSGNVSVTYTDDSEDVGSILTAGFQLPVFAAENRVYFTSPVANQNQVVLTKDGIDYVSAAPNATGYPFQIDGANNHNSTQVNVWRENTAVGPNTREIKFSNSATPIVTYDTFAAASPVDEGLNIHGCDGSFVLFPEMLAVCDDVGVGVCNIATVDLVAQVLRPDNTLSVATAEPLLNSVWFRVPSVFSGDSAYATQAESFVNSRRCDKFGNMLMSVSSNIYYSQSKSGIVVDITSAVGAKTSQGNIVVTPYGFLQMRKNTSDLFTGGFEVLYVQPTLVV